MHPKEKPTLKTYVKSLNFWLRIFALFLIGFGLWSFVRPWLDQVAYGSYVKDLEVLKKETLEETEGEAPISYQTLHTRLLEQNPEYLGWIRIEGTDIDFPFVQGLDNSYYLTHDHTKKVNSFGAIFLDHRNTPEDSRWFLYGHSVYSTAMFGSLVDYRDSAYFKAHPTIKLYFPDEIRTYTIFSVETVDADLTRITDTDLTEDPKVLVEHLAQVSEVKWEGELPLTTQVLTLVSCEYTLENGRIFVNAALTSIETVPE